jgi:DHA1 family bicyclomycin/chloramphenicol resistance-like MFS transporter
MSRRTPHLTPLLLGILGFTGAVSPLATDMYLASFASIQYDLMTTASMVQLTLSVFFLGNAAGQLLIGPLSDMLGRRRLLLASLSVYTLLSIGLVFTPTIEIFIALRLLLGFFGAAGIVLARAIAVDLSEGETAVKALSLIAMVGGLGPLLAPPIGGLTHELWGWRGTLATLAAISVVMLVLAWWRIPESLPPEQRRTGRLLASFTPIGGLLRTPRYLLFMLTFVFAFTSMIAYISASPFVGQNVLDMTPLMYALAFSASGTALVAGNLVNSRIAARVGPARMLGVGIALLLTGALGMLALSLLGAPSIWGFILCAFVLTGGAGLCMSNSSALALAEARHARGLGAALLGSTQFAVSGSLAPIVGAWGEHTAVPMGVMVFLAAVAACVTALLGARSQQQ